MKALLKKRPEEQPSRKRAASPSRPVDGTAPAKVQLLSVVFEEPRTVYCDGACARNGKANARAGVGVFFGDGDSRNVSERLHGKQTNQRAELMAAVRALQQDPRNDLVVRTDSEYVTKAGATLGCPARSESMCAGRPRVDAHVEGARLEERRQTTCRKQGSVAHA